MRNTSLVFVAVSLLAACASPDAGSENDLARLQGTWRTVSLVSNGHTQISETDRAPAGADALLVYEGSQWKIVVGEETVASGIFRIDAARTPKEIDILDESGARNEASMLGIYELDGDRYRFCLAPPGAPRPSAFATVEGDGNSLGQCQRKTP